MYTRTFNTIEATERRDAALARLMELQDASPSSYSEFRELAMLSLDAFSWTDALEYSRRALLAHSFDPDETIQRRGSPRRVVRGKEESLLHWLEASYLLGCSLSRQRPPKFYVDAIRVFSEAIERCGVRSPDLPLFPDGYLESEGLGDRDEDDEEEGEGELLLSMEELDVELGLIPAAEDPEVARVFSSEGWNDRNTLSIDLSQSFSIRAVRKKAIPLLWRLLFERGFCYFRLTLYKQSLQDFYGTIAVAPKAALPHYMLGCFYHDVEERFHLALQMWKKAARLEPDVGLYHATSAMGYLKTLQIEKAYRVIRRANQLDPNSSDVKSFHYLILASQDRCEDALRVALTTVEHEIEEEGEEGGNDEGTLPPVRWLYLGSWYGHLLVAEVHLKVNLNFEEAKRHLKLSVLHPDELDTFARQRILISQSVVYSRLFLTDGRNDTANIAVYSSLNSLRLNTWNPLPYHQQTYSLFVTKYLVSPAIHTAIQCLRLAPRSAMGYNNIAWVTKDAGREHVAEEYFHRCIELSPSYQTGYSGLGQICRDSSERDRWDESKGYYEQALRLSLTSHEKALSHLYLCELYRKRGRDAMASSHMARAELFGKQTPHPERFFNEQGHLYCRRGDTDAALKSYSRAFEFNERPLYLTNQGTIKMWKGRYEEALEDAHSALELDARFEFAYAVTGNVYLEQGEYEQAIEPFRIAAAIAPKCSDYKLVLPLCYQRMESFSLGFDEMLRTAVTLVDIDRKYHVLGQYHTFSKLMEFYREVIDTGTTKASGFVGSDFVEQLEALSLRPRDGLCVEFQTRISSRSYPVAPIFALRCPIVNRAELFEAISKGQNYVVKLDRRTSLGMTNFIRWLGGLPVELNNASAVFNFLNVAEIGGLLHEAENHVILEVIDWSVAKIRKEVDRANDDDDDDLSDIDDDEDSNRHVFRSPEILQVAAALNDPTRPLYCVCIRHLRELNSYAPDFPAISSTNQRMRRIHDLVVGAESDTKLTAPSFCEDPTMNLDPETEEEEEGENDEITLPSLTSGSYLSRYFCSLYSELSDSSSLANFVLAANDGSLHRIHSQVGSIWSERIRDQLSDQESRVDVDATEQVIQHLIRFLYCFPREMSYADVTSLSLSELLSLAAVSKSLNVKLLEYLCKYALLEATTSENASLAKQLITQVYEEGWNAQNAALPVPPRPHLIDDDFVIFHKARRGRFPIAETLHGISSRPEALSIISPSIEESVSTSEMITIYCYPRSPLPSRSLKKFRRQLSSALKSEFGVRVRGRKIRIENSRWLSFPVDVSQGRTIERRSFGVGDYIGRCHNSEPLFLIDPNTVEVLRREIYQSSFGIVYSGFLRTGGEAIPVAVRKSSIERNLMVRQLEQYEGGVRVMSSVRGECSNVLRCHGGWFDEKRRMFYTVTDPFEVSLTEWLSVRIDSEEWTPELRLAVILQLAQGLFSLEQNGVLVPTLLPEDLLMTDTTPEATLKISNYVHLRHRVAVDQRSRGIREFGLMCLKLWNSDLNLRQVGERIPEGMPETLWNLVLRCRIADERNDVRPSMEEVVSGLQEIRM